MQVEDVLEAHYRPSLMEDVMLRICTRSNFANNSQDDRLP